MTVKPSPVKTVPLPTSQPPTSNPPAPATKPPVTQAAKPTAPPARPITIQDKKLIESVLYLKQNNLLPASNSALKFESVKEAEDEKKEDISAMVREKVSAIKQDIADLQKSGYNFHLETIKLISVPLKLKIWNSTLDKKDLEKVFGILQKVSLVVDPAKKENEAKIAEKERSERQPEKAIIPTKPVVAKKPVVVSAAPAKALVTKKRAVTQTKPVTKKQA